MHTPSRSKPSAERGLSIVELMIAMVLGLLLIAGVLQVFLGNRQAQLVEQSVSRIEENGRVAMDLITQDLRMSGFYGCSRFLSVEVPLKDSDGDLTVFKNLAKNMTEPVTADFVSGSLRGFERKNNTWTPALTADLKTGTTTIDGRNGSDALAVYFGQPTGMTLNASVLETADVVVKNPEKLAIKKNSEVMISNCTTTNLFTVTNDPDAAAATMILKHEAAENDSASLSTGVTFDTNSKVTQFVERVYFVKDTGRKSPDGTEVFSLYRRDSGGGSPQELVEGIEFLHFLYGEKLPDGKVRYVPASEATLKWANVVSVQVSLLAKSFDSVRTENDGQTYQLLWDRQIGATGTDITHSGKLSLRRVYTATVELRNRVE